MVRKEILAGEDILEMLPVELRGKAKLINSAFKEIEGHPEVTLKRKCKELGRKQLERSKSEDSEVRQESPGRNGGLVIDNDGSMFA